LSHDESEARHRPRLKTEREFLQIIDGKLDRLLRMEKILMALTEQESAAITQLSTDIDTALAAATSHDAALQAVIDGLNDQITALQANDASDAAQIADLTASRDALQAALDSHSTDVVAALTGLDEHVTAVTPTS
jgi:chromosome segregation ATPase